MPLPPYGETKEVPGTPAWRANHPLDAWFKTAKYNAAYDPMHFGDSNHGIPYQSPGGTYAPQMTGDQSSNASTMTYEQQMASGIPGSLSNDVIEGGNFPNPNPNLPLTSQTSTPPWQPPVQTPQQNKGTLFNQGNNSGGASVPTWKPPILGQNPALGTNPIQNRNQQTQRYQSPSTRYARNQMAF